MEKEIKQKKQDLGIFYTDQRIVNFIYDILKIWKEKEDKKNGRWESRKHYPSVIDPAVGEGAFLKAAVQNGFTKTDYIFGLDIDEDAVKKWKKINLLKEFGGKEDDLTAHFFHQNGLDKIHWEQHTKKYRYKLKQKDIEAQQFDAVVGNPPYGGLGIYDDMLLLAQAISGSEKVQTIKTHIRDDLFGGQEVKQIKETKIIHKDINLSKNRLLELRDLSKSLLDYEVWKDEKLRISRIKHDYYIKVNSISFNLKEVLDIKEIEKLKSFPIEILFLERFIQLTKPDGWIAIIIPDGILTNSNSHYVREFISQKAKVEAIISLPRDAFKNVGTSAKTSILFLKKYKDQEKKQKDYPVFLALVESLDNKNFDFIKNNYKKYYNKNMSNKNLVQITSDEKGREVVMVRVDKKLNEIIGDDLMSGRWDSYYYHPKFDEYLKTLQASNLIIKKLGELKNFYITTGSGSKRIYVPKGGVKYVQNINIRNTGIDFVIRPIEIKKDSEIDRKDTRVKNSDVIFNRSGVGTLGRTVFLTNIKEPINISNDVYLIRNEEVNQAYLCVYLMSVFGQAFIDRESHGVSGLTKINTDDMKKIPIVLINSKIQNHIESEYEKMSNYHDKAMQAKKNNQEAEQKKNIEIAEKMLKDLITKTEAVIRGEKKDVI